MRLRSVLLVLLVFTPVASAAAWEVESAEPVDLLGEATLRLPGGSLVARSDASPFEARFSRAVVTVYTWERVDVDGNVHRLRDADVDRFPVENATVRVEPRGGSVSLRARMLEGALALHGEPVGLASPVFLAAPFQMEMGEDPGRGAAPPEVPIEWAAGWAYAGNLALPGLPEAGFPRFDAPAAALAGRVELSFNGGEATMASSSGEMGRWTLGEQRAVGPVGAVQTFRRMVVVGDVDAATLRLDGGWGASGPEAELAFDGVARWTRASGSYEVDGQRSTFEDAPLALDVAGTLTPAPGLRLPIVGADHYAGEGTLRAARVDGVEQRVQPQAGGAVVATLSLVALGALLLVRGLHEWVGSVVALYSRLDRDTLLEHPGRARILALVRARPGIHLRELHREIGGAWGPFAFHLRTMERAGFVAVERQGRYKLVRPAGGRLQDAIPHPVARAIYDALPADGAPMPAAELAAKVGISRELLRYHVKGLEARGLVQRAAAGERTGVARVARAEPSLEAAA